jgi:hypothetical protein
MIIIDTNAVNYILDNNISPKTDFYVPPDVSDEIELSYIIRNTKSLNCIKKIEISYLFRESQYLISYYKMINKHRGYSFLSMRGFGDISILASVETVITESKKPTNLFSEVGEITVVTDDVRLQKKLKKEFIGENIKINICDFTYFQ